MDRNRETWVSNLYQRLEAVCQDIDEFVNKDPVSYVGNQMRTVGDNVKKFCSDVVQDILPPLVDPILHLVETSTGSAVSTKENNVDYTIEDADWGIKNILDRNLETEEKIKGEPLMNLKELKTVLNGFFDEFECDSNTNESSELESSITCNENKEENGYQTESAGYFSVSSNGYSSCESLAALDCDSNNDSTRFPFSSYAVSNDTTRTDEPVSITGFHRSVHGQNCNFEQFEDSMSETGVPDGLTVDFEDLKMDTIDLSDNKELVESCVMVEGGKLPFPSTAGKNKSYKKMIQDAFMSRKRLAKEYKQLAILYGDIDKEFKQSKHENKLANTGDTNLVDSEWELV